MDDPLAFSCPRCGANVSERFYGPCAECRADLAASVGGDRRQIEAQPFEPSPHVTPNYVATKE